MLLLLLFFTSNNTPSSIFCFWIGRVEKRMSWGAHMCFLMVWHTQRGLSSIQNKCAGTLLWPMGMVMVIFLLLLLLWLLNDLRTERQLIWRKMYTCLAFCCFRDSVNDWFSFFNCSLSFTLCFVGIWLDKRTVSCPRDDLPSCWFGSVISLCNVLFSFSNEIQCNAIYFDMILNIVKNCRQTDVSIIICGCELWCRYENL